ncbi:MAG: flagellar hook-associated protein FlgK [Planctomycetota bacterium]
MNLFSSLGLGLSSLNASQAALQTTGHNIANATTPGYHRQRVEQVSRRPQDFGNIQIGQGVEIARVRRIVDDVLNQSLRNAQADAGSLGVRRQILERVEALVNEFSDADLSTAFTEFFDSLQKLADRPEDGSTRREVVEKGSQLADIFNQFGEELRDTRETVNDDIRARVGDANRILTELAELNSQILQAENGGFDIDAANDLRDRQDLLLQELSGIVDVRTVKTSNGAVQVLAGSDFLVTDVQAFTLETTQTVDRDNTIDTVHIRETGARLTLNGGELAGLVEVRDGSLGRLIDDVNELAGQFAYALNQIHVEGSGLSRYTTLTSTEQVAQPSITTAPIAVNGTIANVTSDLSIIDPTLGAFGVNTLVGLDFVMTSGPNEGQRRRVTANDGTGAVQFDRPFDVPLTAGETFQITSLPFVIRNGSFQVRVTNEVTAVTTTFTVPVDIDKILPDSTLTSIAASIDGIPGITASITNTNRLQITSDSPSTDTFSFGEDTSGFLAAIGLGTFFSGSTARSIAVNPVIDRDPSLVAAGRSTSAGDNSNAAAMVALREERVFSGGTLTVEEFLQSFVSDVGSQTASLRDRSESQELLVQQLSNQRQRLSGVNLDEEAVDLITFQRTFQASARFIGVIDELLATLIQTV